MDSFHLFLIFSFYVYMHLLFFEIKLELAANKTYDMLILKLITAKHPERTPLLYYHLKSDNNYSQQPCLS